MRGRWHHATRWLIRGTWVGAAFVVLLVFYSLPALFEHADLIGAWLLPGASGEAAQPLPPLPISYILKPVLLTFLLGLATSGLWAFFARSRLGLLGAVLAGLTLPLLFSFLTIRLNEYLFMASFIAFDLPDQTVPVAVAQISDRTLQPLYLTILYFIASLLPGAALWAGMRWAKLRRL